MSDKPSVFDRFDSKLISLEALTKGTNTEDVVRLAEQIQAEQIQGESKSKIEMSLTHGVKKSEERIPDLELQRANRKFFKFLCSKSEPVQIKNFRLNLSVEERLSLQQRFGLGSEALIPMDNLIKNIVGTIKNKLGLVEGKSYDFKEAYEICQIVDQLYLDNIEGDTVSRFSQEDLLEVFELGITKFLSRHVFELAFMTPERRRDYIAERIPVRIKWIEKIKLVLGLQERKKYSIEDMKASADILDKGGRKASGLISIGAFINKGREIFYKKQYSMMDVIKFVLKTPDARSSWIELQTANKK